MQIPTRVKDAKGCPLLFFGTSPSGQSFVGASDCMKEKCEMWIEDMNDCTFRIIAKNSVKK